MEGSTFVNPIWLTIIAIVSTMLAVYTAQQAQTAEGARRTTMVGIGLLVMGVAVAAVVLLLL